MKKFPFLLIVNQLSAKDQSVISHLSANSISWRHAHPLSETQDVASLHCLVFDTFTGMFSDLRMQSAWNTKVSGDTLIKILFLEYWRLLLDLNYPICLN